VYEFGEFRLDPRQQTVCSIRDGRVVPLTPRVFDTLLYFVEHRGELLDKATLMKAIWPNVVVEENNLNQHVSTLRRALADGRSEHRYILTVPGRGYRFVADVTLTPTPGPRADQKPDTPASRVAPASIAVLPFANLSQDPDKEYFGDAMAEELIHMLSSVPGISVPARTSSFAYKGRNTDVRQIARDLGVEVVVEGSVRSAGDRIRVTVQLIDGETGYHRWSQSFERQFADLFALQDELAASMIDTLRRTWHKSLPNPASDGRTTEDLVAYHLYMQASSLVTRPSGPNLHRAIQMLEQAIERNPGFTRAHALSASARAVAFVRGGRAAGAVADVSEAAERALALDPKNAEALAALAIVHAVRGRWIDCATCFEAASTYDGRESATPRSAAIALMAATGRLREALRRAGIACELAPANPLSAMSIAVVAGLLAHDEEALRWAAVAVELGLPEWIPPIPNIRAQVAQRAGEYEKAAACLALVLPAAVQDAGGSSLIGRVYLGLGDARARGDALAAARTLQLLVKQHGEQAITLTNFLLQWATLLGDLDLSYHVADEMLASFQQEGALRGTLSPLWVPEMRAFRQDPRFQPFVERLGFIPYWQRFGPPDDCELRDGRLICH